MGADIQVQAEDEKNLQIYLREGVSIRDIKNINKAFKMLDSDNQGFIKLEKSKIDDGEILSNIVSKYPIEGEFVILKLDDYMSIMIDKIIHHRKQYSDNIAFESNTSSVSCFLCPSESSIEK